MNKRLINVYNGPAFQAAQIEEKTLRLSPACASLDGRTILFLSDVHLSEFFPAEAAERLIAQIESLRPDLILMGGDYAESNAWQHDFFRMISRIKPPLGIVGVSGNNDCECFPKGVRKLVAAAARYGITILVDKILRIDTGSGVIAIGGIDELRQADPKKQPLFSPRDESALRILISHYPQSVGRFLRTASCLRPHLALAGHTHGGQFSLFGLTPYTIGFELIVRREFLPLVRGWKTVGETEFLVSPGLGTSRVPFRINIEPTIHLLRLAK